MISQIKNILPNSIARNLKQFYLWIRGIIYHGSKYKCNVCKRDFRKMLNGGFDLPVIKEKQIVGAGIRQHICPFCLSTDRDRLVELFLDHSYKIEKQKIKLLHIAPEPALFRRLNKLKNIDYIPATKYQEGIYYPKDITLVDLTDMHFNDGEFDLIICNHVLEHIEDDKLAFSEILRVLRSGGTAILQVPYSNLLEQTYENSSMTTVSQRKEHFGQFDHVRLYGTDYPQKLKDIGFYVNLFDPNLVLEAEEISKLSLFSGEKLFVATKP